MNTEQNLKTHVEALCQSPRIPHTQGYFEARKYIAERIRKIGLEPQYHDFFDIPVGPCRNIYVEKGPQEGARVLIGAHYESLPASGVGADDNASAVAVVLELLEQLPNTIPVTAVLFDVEENFGLGALHGSTRFASFYKKPLQQVLIFDLVGGTTLPGLEKSFFQFGNSLPRLQSSDLEFLYMPIKFLEPLGPIFARSDYRAFRAKGIPYTFISSGTPWYYHTEYDTPERLNYQKMSSLVASLSKSIPTNLSFNHQPDWSDFNKFVTLAKTLPGVDHAQLDGLTKKEAPSRWDMIKMYKQLLPIMRREKQALWNRLGNS